MTRIHISFATRDFRTSAEDLARSAEAYFDRTLIYSPESLAITAFRAANPTALRAKKGYGYWRWKPVIIMDALRTAGEGNFVFYTDAGMTFLRDPSPLFDRAERQSIALFQHHAAEGEKDDAHHLSRWCKRDAFVLLDADSPEYWHTTTLLGGFGIYRSDDFTQRFLAAWLSALLDDRITTDQPNTLGKPNLPDFVAHRHDQAALTILARRFGLVADRDPSQYGCYGIENSEGPYFDLHRRRQAGFVNKLRAALKLRTRVRRLINSVVGTDG